MTTDTDARAAANGEAFRRMVGARPRLVGAGLAADFVDELRERRVHHAGPPIAWDDMAAVMQGALIAATLAEGWAATTEEGEAMLASGAVSTGSNQDHATVGPMAGPVSASTPVWVIEEESSGDIVVTPFHEGFGKAQCMGSTSAQTLERFHHTGQRMVPVCDAALKALGGIDLTPLVAEAIARADELHNRCVAGTSMLVGQLALGGLRAELAHAELADTLERLGANGQTFATPVMAWCRSLLRAAEGVPGSSLATTYGRNGATVGLKLSGTGDGWFVAKAPMADCHYIDGYGPEDATPDMGDSGIVEIGGIGAFVMAAAPAFAAKVGETAEDGIAHTLEMYEICHGENPAIPLAVLGGRGAPLGIDAEKVVATGISPLHNTAVAHNVPGTGSVGTAMVRGAIGCYEQAFAAFAPSGVGTAGDA